MTLDEHLQELKDKEIKRLTTPLTRKKEGKYFKTYDCEGNRVTTSNFKGIPTIQPNINLLSSEEILKYAPYSKEASRIRLKMGIGSLNDKLELWFVHIFCLVGLGIIISMFGFFYSFNLGIAFVISLILCVLFFFFVYDFKDDNFNETIETPIVKHNNLVTSKISNYDDLRLLFASKEKIAREMIEKRFPSPQMTNAKFNSVLDDCKDVVESQIRILDALTTTEKTKYEIESRKKLIQQVINKIDDLTNELILSEENNLEVVIEEMDDLINSVKDYK